jgi:hypothetical protein
MNLAQLPITGFAIDLYDSRTPNNVALAKNPSRSISRTGVILVQGVLSSLRWSHAFFVSKLWPVTTQVGNRKVGNGAQAN